MRTATASARFIVTILAIFLLSVAALVISTWVETGEHAREIEANQREVNANQAMIFAVCRAFSRRDQEDARHAAVLVEDRRLTSSDKLNAYQKLVAPETIRHAKAVAVINKLNCHQLMETAYIQGYAQAIEPIVALTPKGSHTPNGISTRSSGGGFSQTTTAELPVATGHNGNGRRHCVCGRSVEPRYPSDARSGSRH